MPAYAEIQAICARLYHLQLHEFEHILSTFPLVSATARERSLAHFLRLSAEHEPPTSM
jgi:hypothetical protein